MMKRLFAAIKIHNSEDLLSVYYSLRQLLKHETIRWVEPDKLHLTLKFFGETAEDKIESINQTLLKVASDIKPFNLTICKTGVFGSSYNPRVVWLGFQEEELLKEIGKLVNIRLAEAGFPSDRQNFVPHLTIGRIKQIREKKRFHEILADFKELELQKFRVNEFCLFESILKSKGPVYIPQRCFQFG